MTPERWARLDEGFARAVELAEDERPRFVRSVFADDPELGEKVLEMLASDAGAGAAVGAVVGAAVSRSRALVIEANAVVGEVLPDGLMGRFQLKRELGAGGMGVVYEAFDDVRRERVALKTLPQYRTVGAREIADLKGEFRALADLVHPNLVRLHELFSDEGRRWFFTMERVEGTPFVDAVRRPELDEPLLRRALRQLCDGVAAIHASGRVHRDLKPTNVLVSSSGHVTVLDFGLARRVVRGTQSSRDIGVAGTPTYMAPEQLADAGATPASDWYAVGGMLFEALTGAPPYGNASIVDVITAKRSGAPAGLADKLATAPPDLAELALTLLAHDPAARPRAAAILSALGTVDAGAHVAIDPPEAASLFVGRDRELAVLADAFVRASDGAPTVVYVAGASGIGKTALCDRFVASVRDRALVLRGRCYERENVPFKALDEVVDAIARHVARLDRVAGARLTPRHAGELRRVFPALGRLPAFAEEPIGRAEPQELRRRAFVALKDLLGRLAAHRPVVITIDDLQWGDADSAVVLGELVGPPDPPAVLWIGSYRSEDRTRSAFLNKLGALPSETTLQLAPLSETEARTFARSLLGHAEAEVDAEVDAIAAEAAGSPFFVRELVHRARDRTDLTVATVVAARVAQRPDDARRLLEVVAIAGRPLPLAIALEATALGPGNDGAVPRLRTADLIRTVAGSIATYHDRIRETVTAGLEPSLRAERHRALAVAFENSGLEDATAEVLLQHYRAAGDRAQALRFAEVAAAGAAKALAFDRAIDHYRIAIELAHDEPRERIRRLEIELGDALSNAGRGAEAADSYLAAADGEPDEIVVLERKAAHQLLISGHVDRGLGVSRQVLRRLGIRLPRSKLLAVAIAIARLVWLWFRRRLPALHERTDIDRRQLARLEVERELFEGFAMTETMYGYYFGTSLSGRARRVGEPFLLLWGQGIEAAAWCGIVGRVTKRTARHFHHMDVLASHIDTPFARGCARMFQGVASFLAGSWRDAQRNLTESHALVANVESAAFTSTFAESAHTWALFYLGEFRVLAERCPALLSDALLKGNWLAANAQSAAFGIVAWLVRDDTAGAERELAAAEHRWPKDGFQLSHYWFLLSRAFLALYRRDAARAHAYLLERWPVLVHSQLMKSQIVHHQLVQLRGAVALAAATEVDDREHAAALLVDARRCARRLSKLRLPGSAALGDLLLAGVDAARGRTSEACERLERAIPTLAACDLVAYAAAARYRLGMLRGAAGAAAVSEVTAWLDGEGIVDTDRFLELLAPGFGRTP